MQINFPAYTAEPDNVIKKNKIISDFTTVRITENIDEKVVKSFGEEWTKFNSFDQEEIMKSGNEYFDILPSSLYNPTTKVLDVGCGTGRWTKFLTGKVGLVDAVDPSTAIFSADELLKDCSNVRLTRATSESLPFANESYDLVMSIGVLHHIPDTFKAMQDCVSKVKKGGYFYAYLYYSLDNRGPLFRGLFKIADLVRKVVSSLPEGIKKFVCEALAIVFYMPLVLLARFLFAIGLKKISDKVPLAPYRNKSFFVIRNDALDRFGTSLEQRFSRKEIQDMMERCGLVQIIFSENPGFWHVIGKNP